VTGFDDRVRAAARELDRADLLREFVASRLLEDAYRRRVATPEGRRTLEAADRAPATAVRGRAGSGRPAAVEPRRQPLRPGADADLEALADAAAAGSGAARHELAVRLWPPLARYCAARWGGTSAEPVDALVQDVLRRVLDRVRDRGDQPVLALAYTVAAQEASGHVRRAADRVTLPRAGSAALLDALERLPRAQRDVVVLRVLLGCSAEETAEHLGTTPGAVRVAQHRAMSRVGRAGTAGA
jgi:RNA polymerase sigma-70 factor, ECF subfamily